MNTIELVLRQPWVARAGWTLVHFLWQGTVIAILLAVARSAARRHAPRARYAMACVALGFMAVAPLATFLAAGGSDARTVPAPVWRVSAGANWERVLPWLVVAWLCGVAVCSVRLIGGWRLTAQLRSVGVKPAPPEWQRVLEGLMRRLRVSASVRLLVSTRVTVPVVVGWLRPLILMPAAALTGVPLDQVEALLAHELAHVFRHDYLVNVLQNTVEALLFYHPAVWWVSGQIRAERELCCDDLAVAASGDVLTYARALADLDSRRRARLQPVLAADGGSLLQRIRRLVGEPQTLSHSLPGPGTAWALSLLWLAGVGAAAIHGAASPGAPAQRAVFDLRPHAGATEAPALLRQAPTRIKLSTEGRPGGPPHLVKALLFDPFFATPQAPAADASVATPPKKARVEGTVTSLAGGPIKKATVRLVTIDLPTNVAPVAYSETTDEAGKFAIGEVPPGSYTLSAIKAGFVMGYYGERGPAMPGATVTLTEGAELTDLAIRLTPQGIVTGHVTDQDGEPVPHGWVKLFSAVYVRGRKQWNHRLTNTNSLGNFTFSSIPPGRYCLSAEVLEQSPDVEPGMGDVATYYPNALDATGAAMLDVAAGARLEGINVRLRRERVYSVTGKVMWNGAPMKTPMNVLVSPPAGRPSWSMQSQEGSFRMHDQLPGVYVLQVASAGGTGARGLTGRLEFTLKDSNLDGLVLALEPGVEVSGVFKLDEGDWRSQFNPPASAPGAPSAPTFRPLVVLSGDEGAGISRNARASDDGAFQLPPAGAGRYLLDVAGLPKGAYVKSAHYGPQDVTRTPMQVGAGGGALEIVVSLKGATVTGALLNEKGEPLRGIIVTAWPKRPNPGITSHGVKSIATDQNGAFRIAGLAPGDYYVAAWEEIATGLRQDPDFLSKFTDQAAAVTLDEGSQTGAAVKPIPKDVVAAEVAKLP